MMMNPAAPVAGFSIAPGDVLSNYICYIIECHLFI
nr:MAG TPA: hypothetical protein [Caudoviricetes sp.]